MQWLREAGGYDEIFDRESRPRPHYAELVAALDAPEIARREKLIQLLLLNQGITFAVYGEQRCLHEGIVPWELVLTRKEFKRELLGVAPPRNIFTHVLGIDLIRNERGEYLVLEDNCRCPSGVSYVPTWV